MATTRATSVGVRPDMSEADASGAHLATVGRTSVVMADYVITSYRPTPPNRISASVEMDSPDSNAKLTSTSVSPTRVSMVRLLSILNRS